MDTPTSFRDRDPLDAVGATFIFQTAISALAFHNKGDIFDASLLGFVDIQDFDLPPSIISVAAVHPKEFAGEKRCFVTTSSSLNCDDSIFLIHNIFGQQGNLDLFE